MDKIGSPQAPYHGFRRLSLTLSLVGLGTTIAVVLSLRGYGPDAFFVSGLAASSLFFISNLAFHAVRRPRPWMSILQASEVAAIGLAAAVVSDPAAYDGIMLFSISVLLFAKHGVIRNRLSLFGMLAGGIVIDSVLSFMLHDAPFRLVIAMAALAVGVYAIIYYAFYDEILSLLRDVRTLKQTAQESERSLLTLRRDLARARIAYDAARATAQTAEDRVQALEEQVGRYEAVATPVDFEQFDLSEREIDVLRLLVQTRGRNRDIGEMLEITERTVKSHIYRICNKVGVDTRLELVELFRWNWPQETDRET